MDLKQLKYFAAIVETGGYARAADVCHVTQPTLSSSMTQLEAELGAPLLERGAFGARPTAVGALLFERAKLLLAEVSRTRADIATLNRGEGGHVVVGVSPMTECALAPAILSTFLERWPHVEVTMVAGLSGELFARLVRGELDLVFNSPPRGMELPAGLEMEILKTVKDVVIGRADHPLASGGDTSLRTLAGYKWIITSRASQTINSFFAAFQDEGVDTPRDLIRMDSFPLVARAVADRNYLFGISPLLLDHFNALAGGNGLIRGYDVPSFAFPRILSLATRAGGAPSKAAREMIAIIREACAGL